MATTDELLDILMKDYKKPEDLIGENGLLTDHLGYDKHAPLGKNSDNSRNGASKKTIIGEFGNLDIAVPRDRNSTFEPVYQAPTAYMAAANLEAFAIKWDTSHPSIAKSWQNNWERIIPLFSYPPEIRKASTLPTPSNL